MNRLGLTQLFAEDLEQTKALFAQSFPHEWQITVRADSPSLGLRRIGSDLLQ